MTNITTPAKEEQSSVSSSENKKISERFANAIWKGNFKEGKGAISTQSEVLKDTNYSYKTRFENGEKGTNPEELLAAAHAGCFTMSVAAILNIKGNYATSLNTKATVTMEGLKITTIHLSITGDVTGITAEEFSAIVKEAMSKCLISKILNIPVTSEDHFIA